MEGSFVVGQGQFDDLFGTLALDGRVGAGHVPVGAAEGQAVRRDAHLGEHGLDLLIGGLHALGGAPHVHGGRVDALVYQVGRPVAHQVVLVGLAARPEGVVGFHQPRAVVEVAEGLGDHRLDFDPLGG